MLWIYGCLIFIIGIIVGIIATRLGTKGGKKQKELQKELEKSQYELEQYRQELVDHFAQSANLMENISKDYEKLYSHMAKTSTELMPSLPTQDNPFSAMPATLSVENNTEEKHPDTPQEETVEASEEKATEALSEHNETEDKKEANIEATENGSVDESKNKDELIEAEEKKKLETEKPNNNA